MKVLHINTKLRGGAGKACLRLHQGLSDCGVDSKLLVLDSVHDDLPEIYNFTDHYGNAFVKWYKKLLAKTSARRKKLRLLRYGKPQAGFDFLKSPFDITHHPLYDEADIIHLHWVTDFLDYPSFFQKNTKPVVWTVHDSTVFTGGYPLETDFPFEDYKSIIEQQAAEKKKLYQEQHFNLVSPSKWMAAKIKQSELTNNFPIYQIPNSVNTDVFCFSGRELARQQLRLSQDSTIVLFVADCISDRHKGMDLFLEAIRTLYVNNLMLLVVGRFWEPPAKMPPYRYLGEVKSEEQMALLYNAADAYVISSIEDNFPNTVLESLACGTPVAGFDIGGISEQIEHGENGVICEKIEPFALKTSILELLQQHEFDRSRISKEAHEKYALHVQAERMKAIYNSILHG